MKKNHSGNVKYEKWYFWKGEKSEQSKHYISEENTGNTIMTKKNTKTNNSEKEESVNDDYGKEESENIRSWKVKVWKLKFW